MSAPIVTPKTSPPRPWRAWMVALAISLAAATMLVSLLLFREDQPITWPPSSPRLHAAAFMIVGVGAIAAMLFLFYLAISLLAIMFGRRGWREFLDSVVFLALAVAVIASAASISLKVFYWPWARASAVRTILSNDAKWRLLESSSTLADRFDDTALSALRAGLSDPSPSVQAASAYALAASGRKQYLDRLLAVASRLPESRPDGSPPSNDNNISSREDVVFLFNSLCDAEGSTPEQLSAWLHSSISSLEWDRSSARYIIPAFAPPSDRAD